MTTASLRMVSPPSQGSFNIGFPEGKISGWWRSIKWDGGFWYGGFRVDGEKEQLYTWFFDRLWYEIRESIYGLDTWDGFIADMDMVIKSSQRLDPRGVHNPGNLSYRFRRSLTDVYNRVKVDYIDPTTNEANTTAWATDANSVAIWGQRDLIARAELPTASATDERSAQLKLNAWPNPYLVGLEETDEEYVEVTVIGKIHTANYRYVTTDNGSTTSVNSWLNAILTTDCEFLSPSRIDNWAGNRERTIDTPKTAWEMIQSLISPEASSKVFRVDTLVNGKVMILEVTNEPIGYLTNGVLTNLGMEPLNDNPYMARPGVYRILDTSFPPQIQATSPFLLQANDFIVDEIEVDAEGLVVPHTAQLEAQDALRMLVLQNRRDRSRRRTP